MAGEIQIQFGNGNTLYAVVRNRNAQPWNGLSGEFQNYSTALFAGYPVSLTEQGTASKFYAADFPTAITAPGVYSIDVRQQAGGSAAETDNYVGGGDIEWNGTARLPLADTANSGQLSLIAPQRVYRGEMLQNFMFKLVDCDDHLSPFTSGIVSGQISKDGNAFAAMASGIIQEVGLGVYKTTFTSGDMTANTLHAQFNAVGVSGGKADVVDVSFILQRSSGQ